MAAGRVAVGLWQSVRRYRRRTALAIGLLVLAKIASVLVPLSLKQIVDHLGPRELQAATLPGAVLTLPVFLLLAYALLRFASTLFTELRDLLFARVTLESVSDFTQRSFAHLLALGARFHNRRNTGELIRDLERGSGGIEFLLGAGLFTVVPTLVEFVGVLTVMTIAGYSGWFTLLIVLTFASYAAYTGLMTRRREQRQREVNRIDSNAHGRLVDRLLNVEAVRTHARAGYEAQRYGEVRRSWVEASVQSQRALSTLHIGQGAIIAGGVAAVMLLAGSYAVEGRMSVGDLVLVNAYLIQLCLPLNTLGFVFRQTLDALVDSERVFALLDERPEIADSPTSRTLQLRGGSVAFEHVGFAYEPGRPILDDFSLELPAGATVAVVGGSGSGKSTLARLLLRLYDPDGGRVTIDGQDLRAVTQASLHAAIGVVAQDTALFNDTIAYNIAYGRPGAGLPQVIEAAKAAQVHEFIVSLPKQYDTLVGERGVRLSGGERQRIAIARALLRNPPLLIFDEATSALDTRAERAIQSELDRIARDRTTLVIAHRLSTIVDADSIVVLDRGRIVETGRHDDLLARNGLYTQLWNLQLQQREFERMERRLATQPVNLAALLAGAIDALQAPIASQRVTLYTDIDAETASVSGDPGALAGLLFELGRQALDATPAAGRMEIRLERRDGNARVTIADGRSGVRPDGDLPAVPAHAPPDPLAMRTLVERQGGHFEIELPDREHGMRYVIELPLQAVAVPPRPPAAPREPGPRGAGGTPRLPGLAVMCIDDHADSLDSLAVVLELEGAQVRAFGNAEPALAWLKQEPGTHWPDLLVCDITLADGMDGHQFVRALRQLEAGRGVPLERRLPAIALTGHAGTQDRLAALMAGFQLHLAKPVHGEELVHALETLAQRGSGRSGGA
jgi:ATP-binding cassette subfamily B protein